jgi:hypothetical protein
VTVAGRATDNVAVGKVDVAVKRAGTTLYLRADGTWATGHRYLPATLANPGADSTTYSLTFTAPAEGGYSFQSRATDSSGNISSTKPTRVFAVG